MTVYEQELGTIINKYELSPAKVRIMFKDNLNQIEQMPEYSYKLKRKKNKELQAEFEERTQMFHEMIKQEKEKNKKAKLERRMS